MLASNKKKVVFLLRAEVAQLKEALRGCVQYGIDEDDQVWYSVDPRGAEAATRLLGIDAAYIRAEFDEKGGNDGLE